ncbi:hypothetical protein FOVSG1_005230 [Fusarium oxysporum f. sp. vasinfectum]
MRATQWRSIKGGIDKNLTLIADAKLPKNASSLPKGQTLVKVAYASVNHLDYKVAEMPLTNFILVRSLGADEIVDYKSEDPIEVLKKKEERFDFILDTVFNDPYLYWQSHQYLKPEGQYVCVGLPPRFQTFKSLLTINLLPRWLGGGKRKFKYHSVTANRKDFGQVADWMKDGKIKAVIEEEFGLEDAGRAYARLKEARTRGKLVVRVGGEAGVD